KDAGDDPDVTDGAHLTADVTWLDPDDLPPVGPGGTHPAPPTLAGDPGATPDSTAAGPGSAAATVHPGGAAAATAGLGATTRARAHISTDGTADRDGQAGEPSSPGLPAADAVIVSAGGDASRPGSVGVPPTGANVDGPAISAAAARAGSDADEPGSVGDPATDAHVDGPAVSAAGAATGSSGASGPASAEVPATGANVDGRTVSASGAANSGSGADESGLAGVPAPGDLSAAGGGGGWAVVTVDGVTLVGGEGVGTVTLPGLGLEVGGPAINPVPRRMISAAVREVTDRPVLVTLSVPGGEAMAAKTSNDRLGIVGGISILGTTGIVKPFSTASYRASVVQQVDVAAAQGQWHMALSTGSRSDQAAQRLLPELDPVCFVEVGDFTGIALRRAAGSGIDRITWVGMAGKIAKLAAGVLMTHYRRSKVDGELLAEVARVTDAPAAVVEAATATATARHFAEVCLEHGAFAPLAELCRRAALACAAHVDGALAVEVIMVDFAGEEVLARA
ncbi:MAG TPA: cobalt-precorrin-5B (C(1))-methyltransferase CbiD, partial [Acidimicrobiales bacterium]|nr:cobalt-precorrin-5B (C(1))-methyltransferase CbiD [Acidimicrobiales bacterium]